MQNLFIRIFLSSWVQLTVIVILAGWAGYYTHQRMEQIYSNFEIDEVILRASEVLGTQGITGLKVWLENINNRDLYPYRIYIINQNREDILGREIPRRIFNWQSHFDQPHHRRDFIKNRVGGGNNLLPRNLRPRNFVPMLIGPNNQNFEVYTVPKETSFAGFFNDNLRWLIFMLALLMSLFLSFLLAKWYLMPFKHFKSATLKIAEGKLETRISSAISGRKDEMGELARDIDAMTEKLQHFNQNQQELARNISHELRSPLSRMQVALDIAKQSNGNNAEFDRISKEIETLNEMIEYILKYSKIDQASTEEATIVNIEELTADVINDINFEYKNDPNHDNEIILESEKNILFSGYEDGIRSALENVIRNSIKYSPNNSSIQCKIKNVSEKIIISITDEGKGIKDSDKEKLFQPFYRHPSAQAGDSTGTGLGLAIAKSAVEWNKGHIEAITTKKDFTIKITLPAYK